MALEKKVRISGLDEDRNADVRLRIVGDGFFHYELRIPIQGESKSNEKQMLKSYMVFEANGSEGLVETFTEYIMSDQSLLIDKHKKYGLWYSWGHRLDKGQKATLRALVRLRNKAVLQE